MQKVFGSQFKLFFLFLAFGTGVTFACGLYIQFHAVSIDFWDVLFYGRHMTLAEPASLYNGFYPFGYAFIIGRLPFTYVLPLSYILNALLAGLFIASVSTLVAATRSFFGTAIALFASMIVPLGFQTANTLSPDMGSLAFTSFAVFLMWRDHLGGKQEDASDLHSILIGASLGLACLWRTHAIVSSGAILIGYFLLRGLRPFRSRALMIGGFLFIFSFQVIVNLVSGHGPLETGQAFNLYKYFYGVNWTNPPTPAQIKDFSLIETIRADPRRAFRSFFDLFSYYMVTNWIVAALFLLAPKGRFAKYALFSMTFIVIYAIPISFSDSPRGPILLMGAYTSALALLSTVIMEQAGKWFRNNRLSAFGAGALFLIISSPTFYGWIVKDIDYLKVARAERKNLTIVEDVLISNGMKSPTEVFADRYDFYTPNTMPYRSRQIGNWSEGWVWGYSDEFPHLPNDSWESFAKACKEQGVRYLVLSQNSVYRGEFFPFIYDDQVDLNALGLRFLGQRGKMRIYQFK